MPNADPSWLKDDTCLPRQAGSTFDAQSGQRTTDQTEIAADLTGRAASSRVEFPPGTVFASYLLQEKLGDGGMGSVYKALHLRLKKVMALKILPFDKFREQDAVTRFEREMEAAGRVRHPNVVPAFDAGVHNGVHFISMEYIDGCDLSRLVGASGPFSVARACIATRSAALGLAAAHKVDVIHRDIKPANILADREGGFHILDLGLALLGDDQSGRTELTTVGAWYGTPDYMAPEQWDDSHTVDSRTDLYALGCTLYYLLVGHAPYDNPKYKSMVGKMTGHVIGRIPDLKTARPDVPDGLAAIYTQLMAKRPEDRIQTAAELAVVLEPYTRQAQPGGPSSLPVRVPPAAQASPSQRTSQRRSEATLDTIKWRGWPASAPTPAIAPFETATAANLQQLWAKFLKLPVQHTNSLGMKFRLIPPGEFFMGSTDAEIAVALKEIDNDLNWPDFIRSEGPQHKVILTQPFYLGVHLVTQADYEAVTELNPSHFSPWGAGSEAVSGLATSRHPVEMVSWDDATDFCQKLRQMEAAKRSLTRDGDTANPLDAIQYRLPTEAEWEFSCRAGTTAEFWFGEGSQDLCDVGWYSGNSEERTHPVGELAANPFGLYDMHGNVWEWISDWHGLTYFQQFVDRPAVNPTGPPESSSRHVLRGGGWSSNSLRCRSAFRGRASAGRHGSRLGFRLAFAPPEILGTQW